MNKPVSPQPPLSPQLQTSPQSQPFPQSQQSPQPQQFPQQYLQQCLDAQPLSGRSIFTEPLTPISESLYNVTRLSIVTSSASSSEPTMAELLARSPGPSDDISLTDVSSQRSRHPTVRGASQVMIMALEMDAKANPTCLSVSHSPPAPQTKLKDVEKPECDGQEGGSAVSMSGKLMEHDNRHSRSVNGSDNRSPCSFWEWLGYYPLTLADALTCESRVKLPNFYAKKITKR